MKPKICIVASSAMTINAFLLEPIKKLGKHYDVHVVINGYTEDINECLDNITIFSVPIERNISPIQDLKVLFLLINLFRKHHFKSVHSVTPKAGLLAMIASALSGVSIRIHTFTGQVWVTRSGVGRRLLKKIDKLISWLATGIIVDSASQRQFLLNEGVVTTDKSLVLAHGSISGVDTTRFVPNNEVRSRIRSEYAIKSNDIIFLFIGRLNRDKGVLDLAKAFSRLAMTNVHLLVVGPDESGISLEMKEVLIDCLENVHFVGFSSHPENYMAAADCLCLPSYREGFGSVVIEAAAVGIPSIGSRIYGVKDAIVEGHTGLLFEAHNINEINSCMVMMTEKKLRDDLGKNARERVLADFASEHLASAWLEYYQARI